MWSTYLSVEIISNVQSTNESIFGKDISENLTATLKKKGRFLEFLSSTLLLASWHVRSFLLIFHLPVSLLIRAAFSFFHKALPTLSQCFSFVILLPSCLLGGGQKVQDLVLPLRYR